MTTIPSHLLEYQGKVPGASLLIIQNEKILSNVSIGFSDLEGGIESSPSTNYRLASISKQFTAVCVLLLMQDGKLYLKDPINKFLKEFVQERYQEVTIHHMLCHTSGIWDYEDMIPESQVKQLEDQDVVNILLCKQGKFYFNPGTSYRYSNSAYVLLGLIVEIASGMSLSDFMKKRIFDPLVMNNTVLYEKQSGIEINHRAFGYSFLEGNWRRTDQDLTSGTRGDGGIYSSVEDLVKWEESLRSHRLLSKESTQLAFQQHSKVIGEPYEAYYGFGWRITGETLWHSGESIGFRNVMIRWPQKGICAILLTNRNDPEPYQKLLQIVREALNL
eukprot:TRINITY_DN6061_c0_g1_i1.p1 TRINITY_DN6061_c0_g1~~TRINITY_DN6061_c0_g1_i1.p1  ORF type:complete len:331 (-),score=58.72 TRINITY_DN6061_c0_g1_i1:784-1776(-)